MTETHLLSPMSYFDPMIQVDPVRRVARLCDYCTLSLRQKNEEITTVFDYRPINDIFFCSLRSGRKSVYFVNAINDIPLISQETAASRHGGLMDSTRAQRNLGDCHAIPSWQCSDIDLWKSTTAMWLLCRI